MGAIEKAIARFNTATDDQGASTVTSTCAWQRYSRTGGSTG